MARYYYKESNKKNPQDERDIKSESEQSDVNLDSDEQMKQKQKKIKKDKKERQRLQRNSGIPRQIQSNGEKDEQQPNKREDQSINDYIDAIQLLESQDIKDKMNKQLSKQLTFMEKLQCQICFLNFDIHERKPTKWCKNIHPGYICTFCLKNIKQCHMCRKDLEPKFAKEDVQLICWLMSSQRLGIVIPTVFQTIPKELHETLRKIKIHQFYRKEKAREVMKKRQTQASLIKLNYAIKALKSKMQITQRESDSIKKRFEKANQELEEKNQQVFIMTQKLQGVKKQMKEAQQEFQLMSYMINSKTSLSPSNKYWEKILEVRNNVARQKNSMLKAWDQYIEAIRDNLMKHQKQAHGGKPYHRLTKHQMFRSVNNRNPSIFLYRDRPSSEVCQQCQELNMEHSATIDPIQIRISNHNEKLHSILKNKAYLISQMIQKFVPENLKDCRNKVYNSFRLMDIEEDRLIERMLTSEIEDFDVEKFRAQINEMKMDEEMQEKQEKPSK